MNKISMNPIVEMDGDEMTRILWKEIKEELLLPFVDLNTEYYDLGLPHRDETDDQVTVDAAMAARRLHVAVKCATITPNAQRLEEYKLKKMWKSPNATIRALLDGTVFRAPILISHIKPAVKNWENRVPGAGSAELVYTAADGTQIREEVASFEGPGVLQAMHNKDASILSFAHSCFRYALSTHQDLWFSTKDTISKQYDQTFKLLFQDVYEKDYKEQFEAAGLQYFYTLIDDAVARVIRSKGGYIWACKNYDGDVSLPTVIMNTKRRTAPLPDIINAISREKRPQPIPSPRSLPGAALSVSEESWTATRR